MTIGDLLNYLLNTHIQVLFFDIIFWGLVLSVWGFLTVRYFQSLTQVTVSKIIFCVVPSYFYFLLLSRFYNYLDFTFFLYLRLNTVPI